MPPSATFCTSVRNIPCLYCPTHPVSWKMHTCSQTPTPCEARDPCCWEPTAACVDAWCARGMPAPFSMVRMVCAHGVQGRLVWTQTMCTMPAYYVYLRCTWCARIVCMLGHCGRVVCAGDACLCFSGAHAHKRTSRMHMAGTAGHACSCHHSSMAHRIIRGTVGVLLWHIWQIRNRHDECKHWLPGCSVCA